MNTLTGELLKSKRKLDIYGNPVNEWDAYLSPGKLKIYSALLAEASGKATAGSVYADRVKRLQLSLEYTALQQARFFGAEQGGMYTVQGDGYVVKMGLRDRIAAFAKGADKARVTELSEGGLSPAAYSKEWNDILREPPVKNKMLHAVAMFQYPFSEFYPAKGERTLTDGVTGYADYSYNWLLFVGMPMIANVRASAMVECSEINISFLHDEPHFIHAPDNLQIEISEDGKNYKKCKYEIQKSASTKSISKHTFSVRNEGMQVRYIKAHASLAQYTMQGSSRKLSIACDEILVK
ncbi:MAG: hypothetical protein EOP56_07450 [Sphingobacteriales bacterium]|nr:MAG: hypothetical protein EOP56_07450 [Sphingobacteriales bacterium]